MSIVLLEWEFARILVKYSWYQIPETLLIYDLFKQQKNINPKVNVFGGHPSILTEHT
jgi:hypothetical protein